MIFLKFGIIFHLQEQNMTTIIDYSDEPKFSIKTVYAQTGIRPVTLRAWERRHEVLNPHRSENRYRLYSERDVAILRWIKNRVDNNTAISLAVQELRDMLKTGSMPEIHPIEFAPIPVRRDVSPSQFSTELYLALVKHDEASGAELVREAQACFDLPTLMIQVMTPALVAIGEDWYIGKIRITTEHFASAFIRGKLLTLLQSYPARRNAPYLLVGCAPTEQHEINSLMFSVLLRSAGYRVEYLGPDIPIDDLVDYASDEHPDMVILAATMEDAARELSRVQEKLSKLRRPPLFGYGGHIFTQKPALRKIVQGNYLGDSMETALVNVQSLLQNRKTNAR